VLVSKPSYSARAEVMRMFLEALRLMSPLSPLFNAGQRKALSQGLCTCLFCLPVVHQLDIMAVIYVYLHMDAITDRIPGILPSHCLGLTPYNIQPTVHLQQSLSLSACWCEQLPEGCTGRPAHTPAEPYGCKAT